MATIRQGRSLLAGRGTVTGTVADTVAPSVPTGLTANAVSTTQVNLTWNASTDASGIVQSGVASYRVRRGGVLVQTVAHPTLAWNNTGLTAGTAYSYTVSAVDTYGNESAQSSPVAVSTPSGDVTPPTWPGGTVVTFRNVSAYALTVDWVAASDAVGVASYRLERARSADFATAYTLLANATTARTYNDNGLSPSTQYWYRVSAVDAANNRSAYSSEYTTTQVASGGTLLLFDGFDYEVGKTEAGSNSVPSGTAYAKFINAGWDGVKRKPSDTRSFFMWTVTQAEMQAACGYSGPLPGQGSRCLKIEADNDSGGREVYLETSNIPAEVWFQFWIFWPWTTERSYFQNRHKIFYPTNNSYPSSSDKWLIQIDQRAFGPFGGDNTYSSGLPGDPPVMFFVMRDNMVGSPYYSPDPDNSSKLGPNLTPTAPAGGFNYNTWYLLKAHFNTEDNSSGKYEVWIRPYGGSFTKVSEWIGGVTANFTWTGFGAGGHQSLRIPTTIGWNPDGTNYIYYMDDFAMAGSESALPTY